MNARMAALAGRGRGARREQVDVMVRRIGAGDETLTREPRVRFFGPAREKLAQVGPNLLSVKGGQRRSSSTLNSR
jgi:hypothetical protein